MSTFSSPAPWRSYSLLLPFMKPYLRPLVFVIVISLLATALGLSQPWLSRQMIDVALMPRNVTALIEIAIAMVLIAIGGYALNILSSYLYVSASSSMLFDMREALLRHLQTLSPRFYARFRLGDLMSRINSDISDIQRATADTLLSVVSNVLTLGGCIALMLWLDWRMALFSVVLIPVCMFIFMHYQKKLTDLTRQMRERGADLGSMLVETIMGMRVITALNAGENEIARFKAGNNAFVSAMMRMQFTSFLAGAVPGTVLTLTSSCIVLYGGIQVIHGHMTIGTLVAFMSYQARLFGPVQVLMGLASGLSSARVSLARIIELFETQPEVRERPDARTFTGLPMAIRFKNVSLRHGTRDVLREVSFDIPHGCLCTVLGHSGVGKSSLADLIVRNIDPDKGCITVGDVDLKEFQLGDLRKRILLIDQSPYLFNDTISANIRFGIPKTTPKDIARAVRLAGLEGLIARLPDGLETQTGERGLSLSAGERQRIAFARALLRNPDILILDEPTAALDSTTEQIITSSLREAFPAATLIVITHRPELSKLADQIITLKEDGIHVSTSRKNMYA